ALDRPRPASTRRGGRSTAPARSAVNSVPDPRARERMICRFDLEATRPEWALGYHFDIVLRGSGATPLDPDHA
ncbi:MAG TPA: hypothetical protein VLL28_03175, partial [Hyphomicrobiaceae bacterium]|nr:hypothetical protein [Hyphomicrobiaceae bacterium]